MKCAHPPCANEVTEPGLWLAPTSPPGPWVDACSESCAKSCYDVAVRHNQPRPSWAQEQDGEEAA